MDHREPCGGGTFTVQHLRGDSTSCCSARSEKSSAVFMDGEIQRANGATVTPADGAPTSSVPSVTVTDSDVACRAYELYQTRGGEHGHDVGDWIEAEGELHRPSWLPRRDAAI